MAGAMLSVPAVCSAVAAPVWGKVSDRIGRKPVILAAQVFSLLGYLRMISGFGGGSLGAVESYVADVTTDEQREFAYSLYGAVFGLAFVIGPAASGALLHQGLALPFFLATALEAANILFTWRFVSAQTARRSYTTGLRETFAAALAPGCWQSPEPSAA